MRNTNSRHYGRNESPISTLSSDIAAIRRDIASILGAGASHMSDKARETVSRLGDEARHVAEQAREQYDAAHETLSEVTAKRPVTTIVVSMAAGIVVGKLIGMALRGSRSR